MHKNPTINLDIVWTVFEVVGFPAASLFLLLNKTQPITRYIIARIVEYKDGKPKVEEETSDNPSASSNAFAKRFKIIFESYDSNLESLYVPIKQYDASINDVNIITKNLGTNKIIPENITVLNVVPDNDEAIEIAATIKREPINIFILNWNNDEKSTSTCVLVNWFIKSNTINGKNVVINIPVTIAAILLMNIHILL